MRLVFQPTYFYAIAVTDDYHRFDRPKYLLAKQSYCSLIACTEMYDKKSCGKRFAVDVQERFKFDRLELSAVFQMGRRSKVFPSTLTNDLYPLNVGAFGFKKWVLRNFQINISALSLSVDLISIMIFQSISARSCILKKSIWQQWAWKHPDPICWLLLYFQEIMKRI